MNILKQELKMSFRSWLYFTIGILATMIIFTSFFNVFKADAAAMNQLLQNFPPEFKAAFGFADVNLAELEGFYSFIVSYLLLIGAVYGMKLGVSLLSEEGRAKTSDFLLTKPVRRVQIVTAKFLTMLIYIILQNIALFAVGLAAVNLIIIDKIDVGIYALLSFSMFFVQLFFVGVGLALSARPAENQGCDADHARYRLLLLHYRADQRIAARQKPDLPDTVRLFQRIGHPGFAQL